MSRRSPRLAGLLVVGLAACSSDATDRTPPPPPVVVARVDVTPATAAVTVGGTIALTATPRDGAGAAVAGRTITWSSGSPAVATVSATGVVTGIAAGGPVTITATSEGQSGTAVVTVGAVPVATVEVTPGTRTLAVGERAQFTATLRSGAGAVLAGREVGWTSSNAAVASVSGSGEVTGVAAGGPVTITATSEGRSATAQVTVSAPTAAAWSVSNELRQGTLPGGVPIRSLYIASTGEAVAFSGTSLYTRAANGQWNTTPSTMPGSPAVISAHADPAGRLWATGSNGVILRRDAGTWQVEPTGSNAHAFNAIAINADGSGFAVGNPGNVTYRRSAAGTWSTVAVPTSVILQGVGVAGPDFALAIGNGTGNGNAVVLRWNGATWATTPLPIAAFTAYTLQVISPTEAYLLGVAGTNPLSDSRYTVLQWNGTTWTIAFQRPIEIYPTPAGVARCPDGTLYFGSAYGTIYRLRDAAWTPITSDGEVTGGGFRLQCEPDNALILAGNDGLVARYTGTWTTLRSRPDLRSVALGNGGRAVAASAFTLVHRAGGEWIRTALPISNGAPVFIPPAVAAFGAAAVVTGWAPGPLGPGGWTLLPANGPRGTAQAWAASETRMFAVGRSGVIDEWNGTAWNVISIPGGGPTTLDRIHGAGNAAVAIRQFDAASPGVRWDGTAWSLFPAPPPGGWHLPWVFSATSVLNVSSQGIAHWNGTTWTALPGSAPGFSPVAVVARDPANVYLIGSSTIAHYNGSAVTAVAATTGTVRAATLVGTEAIAVGDDGLVLRATIP